VWRRALWLYCSHVLLLESFQPTGWSRQLIGLPAGGSEGLAEADWASGPGLSEAVGDGEAGSEGDGVGEPAWGLRLWDGLLDGLRDGERLAEADGTLARGLGLGLS
jgi:hypothetical protein